MKCRGIDASDHPALSDPITIRIEIQKSPGVHSIDINPLCPYNVGWHGQRCKASHPKIDKRKDGRSIYCKYRFDFNISEKGELLNQNDEVVTIKDPKFKKVINHFLEQILEK